MCLNWLPRVLSCLSILVAYPGLSLSARAEQAVPAPPGAEIARILPGVNLNVWAAASDSSNLGAVFGRDSNVVVFNMQDGSIKWNVPPLLPYTVFSNGYSLHFESGILYLAGRTMGSQKDLVNLSALDLATGEWLWHQDQQVKSYFMGGIAGTTKIAIGIHNGEIRVTGIDGMIVRWRLSDQQKLPVIDLGGATGGAPDSVIGVSMGEKFCVGISGDLRGLETEVAGKPGVLEFPLGFSSPYAGTYTTSPSYVAVLIGKGSFTGEKQGFFICNLKNEAAKPFYISHFSRLAAPVFRIWKDRFLMVLSQDKDSLHRGRKLVCIYDLKAPSTAPVTVVVPDGMPDSMAVGVAGDDLWFMRSSGSVSFYGSSQATLGWLRGVASPVMASVLLSDAAGTEAGGTLNFTLKADRPLTAKTTVRVRTRSGSAKEGVDYQGFDRIVELTPAKPQVQIPVTLIKDQDLEAFESMIMEVVSIEGAWIGNRFANGIIKGSGFSEIGILSKPPAAGKDYEFADWAMTSEGVVAGVPRLNGMDRYFINRLESGEGWVELGSLAVASVQASLTSRIVGARGKYLCASVSKGNPNNVWETKMIVVDVTTDQRVSEVNFPDSSVAMGENGFAVLWDDGRQQGYAYGSNELAWERPYSGFTRGIAGFDGSSLYFDRPDGSVTRRNYSDGSDLAEPVALLDDDETYPLEGGMGFWRCMTRGHQVIGNTGPDGHRYTMWSVRPSIGDPTGALTGNGLGLITVIRENEAALEVIDCATGATFMRTGERGVGSLSAADDAFAVGVGTNQLRIFRTRPLVPGPAVTEFTREEGKASGAWSLQLAETADFPVTVRVISAVGDIAALDPVTIPAGQLTAAFPATVVQDGIPEYEETVPLGVEISGNGKTSIYKVSVTIPANEYVVIPKPKKGYLLVGASSADVDPSGIVVGSVPAGTAVDAAFEKEYAMPAGVNGYGYAVTCNKSHVAIAAADLPQFRANKKKPVGGKVYIYDRKSRKLVKTLEEPVANSGFGAVLQSTENVVLAGAPGIGIPGTVTAYDIAKKSTTVLKRPGGGLPTARFGASIAAIGNFLWIGAPGDSAGKVYQFDVRTGKLIRTLAPTDAAARNFGISLAVLGDRVFVGAPGPQDAFVYGYDLKSGKQVEIIRPPFADGGNFGASLASPRGDVLAVGCPNSLFAPEGGVILYDCSASDSRLVTMLRSSADENLQPSSFLGYLGGTGVAGGIASANSVLAVAVDARRDPLDVLNSPTMNYSRPTVALIDLKAYLPKQTAVKSFSLAASTSPEKSVWELALGAGADESDCTPGIKPSGAGLVVVLPDTTPISNGGVLVLEGSEDLAHWVPCATVSALSGDQWMPLKEGLVMDPTGRELSLSDSSAYRFFRIRCEVP